MEGELHVNTTLLRQHGAEVQQERRIAEQLYEQLLRAQSCAAPEDAYRYQPLLRQTDKLVRYLREMADNLDNMSVDFERLSHQIQVILEDNLYWNGR